MNSFQDLMMIFCYLHLNRMFGCLFVSLGLGPFDLHAVLTANTSDTISENNLLERKPASIINQQRRKVPHLYSTHST